MRTIAVDISSVSKCYETLGGKQTLTDRLLNKSREKFWAIKNVNLSIYQGERVGVIGPNGAGKTTLLKIIAGITTPTDGNIKVRGRVGALIDLEGGFQQDFSGQENIILNGMLIGMTRQEVRLKLEKIIDFSGIRQFINNPFFTYSDGMKFRLAFSIAWAAECDILIMDEIFVAGDVNFQKKTFSAIKNLQREKPRLITIVCSHLPLYIWEFSKRFIELNHGVMREVPKIEMLEMVKARSLKWRESFSVLKKLSLD